MRTPERATRLIIAGSVLLGAGAIVTAKVVMDELSKSRSVVAAEKPTEIPSPMVQPTLRPITPTEAAVIATATRVPSPTAKPPEATVTSTPTTAPATTTSTATATETPKPPENPLPSYGVFFGNVTDPTTGAKVAEMVMASIPQQDGDEIFLYWITSKDKNGFRTHSAAQLKPRNIKGTHFELGRIPAWGQSADYNKETQTITAKAYSITEAKTSGNESTSTLTFVGEGKKAIFKAMRQVISDQSSDQPTTPEKELADFRINTSNWP